MFLLNFYPEKCSIMQGFYLPVVIHIYMPVVNVCCQSKNFVIVWFSIWNSAITDFFNHAFHCRKFFDQAFAVVQIFVLFIVPLITVINVFSSIKDQKEDVSHCKCSWFGANFFCLHQNGT